MFLVSEFNSVGSEEEVSFVYSIQHNESTSMRHSRDVLIPTYINMTSHQPFPRYIRSVLYDREHI